MKTYLVCQMSETLQHKARMHRNFTPLKQTNNDKMHREKTHNKQNKIRNRKNQSHQNSIL